MKAPFSRVFDIFSSDLAGPRPTTSRVMRLLLICVKPLAKWLVAYLTCSTTASAATAFIKQLIIYLLKSPRLIMCENGLCSTASSLDKSLSRYKVSRKTVMACASPSNGRAEK